MKLPWRRHTEEARRARIEAEQRLAKVEAQWDDVREQAAKARRFVAENHISPKIQAIYQAKRGA